MKRMMAVAALALLAAAPLGAQTVRGRVTETRGGHPVAFATITVLDEAGQPAGHGQSDAWGGFSVRLQRGGRYMVRADRLGSRSASTPLSDIRDGADVYRVLVMTPGNEAVGRQADGGGWLPRGLFPGAGGRPATDTRPATARAPKPSSDGDAAADRATGRQRPEPQGARPGRTPGTEARPRRAPRLPRLPRPGGRGRAEGGRGRPGDGRGTSDGAVPRPLP